MLIRYTTLGLVSLFFVFLPSSIDAGMQHPCSNSVLSEYNPNTNTLYYSGLKTFDYGIVSGSSNYYLNEKQGSDDASVKIVREGSFSDLSVNPTTNFVYTLDSKINVIDGDSHELLESIDVGSQPRNIAINPNNNLIYITSYDIETIDGKESLAPSRIHVVDGFENKIVDIIPLEGGRPTSIAVHPNNNRIYVTTTFTDFVYVDYSSLNSLYVIDGNEGEILEKIENIPSYFEYIVVNPANNDVFGISHFQIALIDDDKTIKTLSEYDRIIPIGAIFNPNINKIFVLMCDTHERPVYVIDSMFYSVNKEGLRFSLFDMHSTKYAIGDIPAGPNYFSIFIITIMGMIAVSAFVIIKKMKKHTIFAKH